MNEDQDPSVEKTNNTKAEVTSAKPTTPTAAPAEPVDPTPDTLTEGSPIKPDVVPDYRLTDVFAWANNLVQYVDDLKIELFLFNKNYVMYKTQLGSQASRQLRALFIDEILEYILGGIEDGLQVRSFEEAESEAKVLQYTRTQNVEKLMEVLGWLRTQEHEIEVFNDQEHDLKRIKGVLARCSHKDMKQPFYVIKSLPTSQIMKGDTAWMLREGKFSPFEQYAALKVPADNQLLVIDEDLFVFSQPKLKQLFGYDAKEASIAAKKVAEIEANYKLSFVEGANLQALVKGKRATIKKLQQIDTGKITQNELIDHAEELGVDLLVDEAGAIIIMDDKDLAKFVNLLNDDYIESPLTGLRYEIQKKRELKPPDDDDMLKLANHLTPKAA
jgi:hypothetical protein